MLWRTSAGRWRNEQSLFGDIGGPYWWSMQYDVVQRERTSGRARERDRDREREKNRKKKSRQIERENEEAASLWAYQKKGTVLIGWTGKDTAKRERIPLNFSFSLSVLNATRVPNGSKISSSHLTIMLLEQKQQQRRRLNREHCWERERKRVIDRQTQRERERKRARDYLSPISLVSLSSPTNDRKKLFPPNKSL